MAPIIEYLGKVRDIGLFKHSYELHPDLDLDLDLDIDLGKVRDIGLFKPSYESLKKRYPFLCEDEVY